MKRRSLLVGAVGLALSCCMALQAEEAASNLSDAPRINAEGYEKIKAGDYAGAVAVFRRGLAIFDGEEPAETWEYRFYHEQFLDWLGYSLYKIGKYEEAAGHLRLSLDRYGGESFLGYLFLSLRNLGRPEEAAAIYEKRPPSKKDWLSHHAMAVVYLDLGTYNLAARASDAALELKPDVWIACNRILIDLRRHDLSKIDRWVEMARKLKKPADFDALLDFSFVLSTEWMGEELWGYTFYSWLAEERMDENIPADPVPAQAVDTYMKGIRAVGYSPAFLDLLAENAAKPDADFDSIAWKAAFFRYIGEPDRAADLVPGLVASSMKYLEDNKEKTPDLAAFDRRLWILGREYRFLGSAARLDSSVALFHAIYEICRTIKAPAERKTAILDRWRAAAEDRDSLLYLINEWLFAVKLCDEDGEGLAEALAGYPEVLKRVSGLYSSPLASLIRPRVNELAAAILGRNLAACEILLASGGTGPALERLGRNADFDVRLVADDRGLKGFHVEAYQFYHSTWLYEGYCRFLEGSYDEMRRKYEAFVEAMLWELQDRPIVMMATCYEKAGARAEAIALIERYMREVKESAHCYWDLGWYYFLDGAYAKTLSCGLNAFLIDPKVNGPLFNAAVASLKLGDARSAYLWFMRGMDATDNSNYAVIAEAEKDLRTWIGAGLDDFASVLEWAGAFRRKDGEAQHSALKRIKASPALQERLVELEEAPEIEGFGQLVLAAIECELGRPERALSSLYKYSRSWDFARETMEEVEELRPLSALADLRERFYANEEPEFVPQNGSNRRIRLARFMADGERLFLADNNEMRVYDAEGRLLGRRTFITESVDQGAFEGADKAFIVEDDYLFIFNTDCVMTVKAGLEALLGGEDRHFLGDGNYAYYLAGGTVSLIDSKGELARSIPFAEVPRKYWPEACAIDEPRGRIATIGHDGLDRHFILDFNLESEKMRLLPVYAGKSDDGWARCIAVLRDGFAVGMGEFVDLFDVEGRARGRIPAGGVVLDIREGSGGELTMVVFDQSKDEVAWKRIEGGQSVLLRSIAAPVGTYTTAPFFAPLADPLAGIIGLDDGSVKIVGPDTARTVPAGHRGLSSGVFEPGSAAFAVRDGIGAITRWNATISPSSVELQLEDQGAATIVIDAATSLVLRKDGERIGIFDSEGRLIGRRELGVLTAWFAGSSGLVEGICESDGRHSFFSWDFRRDNLDLTEIETDVKMRETVRSPDGRFFASLDSALAGNLYVWDSSFKILWKHLFRKRGIVNGASAIAFTPDSRRIVTAGWYSPTPQQWSLEGEVLVEYSRFSSLFESLAVSPDGSSVAFGDYDGRIYLWSIGGEFQKLRQAHNSAVKSLDFSTDGRFLLSAGEDGTAHIWNVWNDDSFRFIRSGEDWLVITHDGYWDSSAGGAGLVAVRWKGRAFSIDQFAIRNNRPDIILGRLGSADAQLIEHYRQQYLKRLRKLGLSEDQLSSDLDAAPEARVVATRQDGRLLEVRASLDGRAAELRTWNLWVNDVPLFGAGGRAIRGDALEVAETIVLNPGLSKIEVGCMNGKGIEAFRSPFYATWEGETRPRLYYIGFGVSEYSDPRLSLGWAAKDALDLAALFEGLEGEGYERVVAGTWTDARVTLGAIAEAKTLLAEARTEDTVVLFIAGHGLHDSDPEATYYYLTSGAELGNLAASAARFEEIEGILQGIAPRSKLFLMDTCESGEAESGPAEGLALASGGRGAGARGIRGAGSAGQKAAPPASATVMEALGRRDRWIYNDVARRSGAVVLSSCRGYEASYEFDDLQNGAFTAAIKAALADAAADSDGDGAVSSGELLAYTSAAVAELVAERAGAGLQHPTVDRDNLSQRVALLLGGGR